MKEFKHAMIIGASSGIGAELVKLLSARGTRVAAVARRGERLEQMASALGSNVIPVEHDVTHYDEVPALFQRVAQELGGLDLVIYVAGVMPPVGPHEYEFAKDKLMIDVNLLGAIAWLNQAAIRLENTRNGSLVAVGSVAGDRGRSGQPVYNASKAALTTYMEALRNRLAKLGVSVVTIKPGPTATEMTASLHMKMMPADRVAEFILEKADKTGEHYVKAAHWVAFAVIRNIPSFLFRRLKI